MGLTEEEKIDRAGTDSDGEGIDLRALPPKEDLSLLEQKIPAGRELTPAALVKLRKDLKAGLRVGTKRSGDGESAKIFWARFPFSMFE